jgi:hypothetical protein
LGIVGRFEPAALYGAVGIARGWVPCLGCKFKTAWHKSLATISTKRCIETGRVYQPGFAVCITHHVRHQNEECIVQGDEVPLIEKIFAATQSGDLPQQFTVEHLKGWMTKRQIVKDDGNPYAHASIDAILSNSDTKNIPTSNKNLKVLRSSINNGGKHEYWF